MADRLKLQFPTVGWKQFLTARKEMLDAYDRATEKGRAHEVETYKGNVAEAEFRRWLQAFLPKRYGVASGYIVSTGLKESHKLPHFDVIIYDVLDSPVLWIEADADSSPQGRSLALPVEYVRAVLEVKSAFSAKTVADSIEHLKDLSPLMSGIDDPNEAHKLHLQRGFCCGTVFFELRKSDQYSAMALNRMLDGLTLRGFIGGLILRANTLTMPACGRLFFMQGTVPLETDVSREQQPLTGGFCHSESIQVSEDTFKSAGLIWAESYFSEFAFNLIAIMEGRYTGGLSSFYGMGNSGRLK